jgi:tight adherence protein B
MLIAAALFLLLFAGIVAAYWGFVVRDEQVAAGVVKRRLRSVRGPKKAPVQSDFVAQQQAMSSIGPLNAFLNRRRSWVGRLQALIEQSGAEVTVGSVLLASGAVALLAYVLVDRFTGFALVGVGAALVALFIPTQVLRFMRTRRLRTFEDQFPEALDLLSRAMRAGHAFTTGIEMVGTEMPKPLGPEFRLLYDRQNYGMAMPDALKSLAERIPVLDARFFVTAVLIQRESGGNLSEVLDNLASVIRERQRVKRQMRVLSAHGRITGWILVCLPPALGIALMSANPEHRNTMFGDPLGIQMMIGAAILQLIGTLIIRKIVNVEY